MPTIILSTLNARYIHASLGLRYLYANMGALQSSTHLLEFTIDNRPIDIAETLLLGTASPPQSEAQTSTITASAHHQLTTEHRNPNIVGFGVYIWNVKETTDVIALIKSISPETIVVIGGPEVSYETSEQSIAALADYVITGAADLSFPLLCEQIIKGKAPLTKVVPSPPEDLAAIALPYRYYNDQDIAHRVLYVEASRGCPFKCEFCLSALDKTALPYNLDLFLEEMQVLYDRGARHFKFVDRTFNLKIDTSIKILTFFLDRLDDKLFLHFELIPDHLPDRLKAIIQQFPQGSLQFEIGIQSFNPDVQKYISRKQDTAKTLKNIHWLRNETNAHLHTDLIIGLPGEDMESFAHGFDTLAGLKPHEIQVGILKRLRGTPIIRHTNSFKLIFNPSPPYNILCSGSIDFNTMQQLTRFARYWDMIANSGRFSNSLPLLLGERPFHHFFRLSNWLYQHTKQTHQLALPRLFELLYVGFTQCLHISADSAADVLWRDHQNTKLKSRPSFITVKSSRIKQAQPPGQSKAGKRQSRYLQLPPST